MRTFRFHNTQPPGGYLYTVPETGFEVFAGDFGSLVNRVRSHYDANKIPVPPNLPACIEHSICLHVPESFCRGEFEENDLQMKQASPAAIRDASLIRFLHLRRPLDKLIGDGKVAEERAAICTLCHLNARNVCTTCNRLKSIAPDMLGDRSTTYDSDLGVCVVDLCILKIKVFIRGEVLRAVSRPAQEGEYPSACWCIPELNKEETAP